MSARLHPVQSLRHQQLAQRRTLRGHAVARGWLHRRAASSSTWQIGATDLARKRRPKSLRLWPDWPWSAARGLRQSRARRPALRGRMPLKKPGSMAPLNFSLEKQKSFSLSDTGSFAMDSFVLNKNGITQSPLTAGDFSALRLEELRLEPKELGRGASSKVYLARHMPTGKSVAVKVLQTDLESDAKARRLVLNEVKMTYAARSDHLITFYDAFLHEVRRPTGLHRPPLFAAAPPLPETDPPAASCARERSTSRSSTWTTARSTRSSTPSARPAR